LKSLLARNSLGNSLAYKTENKTNLLLLVDIQMLKAFQLQKEFVSSDFPDQELCPWNPNEGSGPRPRYIGTYISGLLFKQTTTNRPLPRFKKSNRHGGKMPQ